MAALRKRIAFVLLVGLVLLPCPVPAYSLLTHEQLIDILWKDELTPLLLKRFPDATEKQLQRAHAYAYGGCLVQDMGYYPLGNEFFSDLTHYVRAGDFVANLINESTNLNEYAYALGALAHYCADNSGHPFINRAVAISFPKLKRKFGEEVTYEEDRKSHIRVEFGFDMTQVAKNRYTSDQYHNFIGFEVSKPVLERAFLKTYAIPLDEILNPVDLSIGTFRRAASTFIPELTKVALEVQPPDKVRDKPNADHRLFLYHLSRSEYEKEWGKDYRKPRFGARVLAFILKYVPKVGPLKALAFKIPSQETEDLYIKSVNKSVANYRDKLREVGAGHIELPNLDFDTGRKSRAGEYALGDRTYMKLLDKLSQHGLQKASPDVRENVLVYFSTPPKLRTHSRKDEKAWNKAVAELNDLKAVMQAADQQPPISSPTGRTKPAKSAFKKP
jgi:Zinc dependent phospholipase C